MARGCCVFPPLEGRKIACGGPAWPGQLRACGSRAVGAHSLLVTRHHEPTDAQYRHAITDLVELLDGIASIKVNRRKARHVDLLQGLCFYVHDTAKAALTLIDQGYGPSAGALTRVAVEHATMAQWIVLQPDGVDRYLAELEAQAKTFAAKVTTVGIVIPPDLAEAYKRYEKAKAVQDIRQTEKMFQAVDPSGWMYIQWKTLCGYVHPSSTTAAIYAHETLDGSVQWHREPEGMPDRALLFSLALSMTLATAPLLDLVKGKPHKKRLMKIAEAAHVPLWATADGKPPKHRGGTKAGTHPAS